MSALTFGTGGVLVCDADPAHRIGVVQVARLHLVEAVCITCPIDSEVYELGSTAWYDDHGNLALLIGWQNDHDRARFLTSILEKPWKYEDEFLAAKACAEHEAATDHQVNRDPGGDCLWYCNDCPRRHGYEHEHCQHDDPHDRDGALCCVCDFLDPCHKESDRAAVEDRDPERVSA